MITSYVLIWMLFGTGMAQSGSAEFVSEKTCNDAKIAMESYIENTYSRPNYRPYRIYCFKK